jgi:hypothetical protein
LKYKIEDFVLSGVLHREDFNSSNQLSWTFREQLNIKELLRLFSMKKSKSIAVAPETAKFAPLEKLMLRSKYGGRNGSPNSSATL